MNRHVSHVLCHVSRLNKYLEPFEFCEQSEIDDNIRYKLLQLRNRNEPEFVGMVIPNRLKEIPTNVLSQYELRMGKQQEETPLDEDKEEDDIVSRRLRGLKQLRQIYTLIFQKSINTNNNLAYEDVVNEQVVSDIE